MEPGMLQMGACAVEGSWKGHAGQARVHVRVPQDGAGLHCWAASCWVCVCLCMQPWPSPALLSCWKPAYAKSLNPGSLSLAQRCLPLAGGKLRFSNPPWGQVLMHSGAILQGA